MTATLLGIALIAVCLAVMVAAARGLGE